MFLGLAAQRLMAQPAPRAMSIGVLPMRRIREWGAAWPPPIYSYHFSRKSKTAIRRSLEEPWPSRLHHVLGRILF
jgi:hypothetical protein